MIDSSGRPEPFWTRANSDWLRAWTIPGIVLCGAYLLLGLTLTEPLTHADIMQRCVLVDHNRARIWCVGNVEIGLAYLGVFLTMLSYFVTMYRTSRRHVIDLGVAVAYLIVSFTIDAIAVALLHPFPALLVGDAAVMTFTLLVSRAAWFQRLLGVFVPIIFLTCGIGHFLEGLSYWQLTYTVNTPWTMVTADIGFAVLVNARRYPGFIRGQDIQDELTAAREQQSLLEAVVAAHQSARQARDILEAAREQALQDALMQANCDPLTGLLNHRAFYDHVQEEAQRRRLDGGSLGIAVLDLDNFKFFNDVYGHIAGDEVLRSVANCLGDPIPCSLCASRHGGDEFAVLLSDDGPMHGEDIERQLAGVLRDLGYRPTDYETAIPISVTIGAAVITPNAQATESYWRDLVHNADQRLVSLKNGGASSLGAERVRGEIVKQVEGFSMIDALVAAVDNKDRYTRRHSEEVMTYSIMIAQRLGLDSAAIHTVSVAALLHDVGKIGVPDRILRKPGPLTDEETEAVKLHPQLGAVMVGAVPGLEDTLDAVQHHHERWDGTGYPFGLKAEAIPLCARLMAVADAFSAMTADRPYRLGLEPDRALSILHEGAGVQWDPECVSAFRAAWGERDERTKMAS